MRRKVLLVLFLVVIVLPAGTLGYLYFRKPAQIPAPPVQVAMTPERIARGKYLFEIVANCDDCHSQRDFTRIGGPVVAAGRGRGNVLSDFVKGLPGVVVAQNLTPDRETGLGNWTDGEKIRAIREGVDREGRALFPMMPYLSYRSMSDADVQSVVAYMNSLPPVRNPLPKTELSFPVNLLIKAAPQPVPPVPEPDRSDRTKYGRYLATLSGCGGCHTPAEQGAPVAGKEFAGGEKLETTAGTVTSTNITPDAETGIGKWDEATFLKVFAARKEWAVNPPPLASPQEFTLMPWIPLSQMPQEDLSAIYQFLRTLKPVKNAVRAHAK